jgi:hypothetical protein
MTQLSFAETYAYADDLTGIVIPTVLSYGSKAINIQAKIDLGAEVCLFRHEEGLKLGVPIEQGIPCRLSTLTGTLEAYGHEVRLQTGALAFESVVYFAKYPGLPRNLLGRQGWLRNLRLAVIDYDQRLYLSAYDD